MKNKLFNAITVFPKLFQNYLPGIASAQSKNRTFPYVSPWFFRFFLLSTFTDKKFLNIFQQQKNVAPIIWILGTRDKKILFYEREKNSPLSFFELFLPKKKRESKYAPLPPAGCNLHIIWSSHASFGVGILFKCSNLFPHPRTRTTGESSVLPCWSTEPPSS